MLRPLLHRTIILLLFFCVCILLILQISQFLPRTAFLFAHSQFDGFYWWDMHSEQVYPLFTLEDDNATLHRIPGWSPDGNHVAFILREFETSDNVVFISDNLYLMETSGRNLRPLVTGEDIDIFIDAEPQFAWSPDGQFIAFYLDNYLTPHLWIFNRDGELITKVSGSVDRDARSGENLLARMSLTWSDDSTRVNMYSMQDGQFLQSLEAQPGAVLSRIDEQPVSNDSRSYEALLEIPAWSEIVQQPDDSDEAHIFPQHLTAMTWSYDGRYAGWILHGENGIIVDRVDIAREELHSYEFPPEIAQDWSFNLYLYSHPEQVIVRMQQGDWCRSRDLQMICNRPPHADYVWLGPRP